MLLQLKKDAFDLSKHFFEKRMMNIFLLGLISGFPWVLIGSSLSLWLKEDGLSRSVIGWSGLIFSVYAFNYLWAPIVDKVKIPFLSNKIGHRKSWIFSMQSIIIISLLIWSLLEPNKNLNLIILFGLIIAIASSTQDITIDALRIEQIKVNEKNLMASGASIAVVGWWTGYKLGGFLSLIIAEILENFQIINYWQFTFFFLAIITLLLNLSLLYINESKKEAKLHSKNTTKFITWVYETILNPIRVFFINNGVFIALTILSFIFLFKIGEAFFGRMSVIFYKEIGFSKQEIGIFSKGLGWVTTIFFTLLGGIFTIKLGIYKAVIISGVFMALTNILFAFLYWFGKDYYLFAISIFFDDIAASFATVSFVALISLLVDRNYTATQYALLASIGTAGRTLLSSSSGELVDWLKGDWGIFFILTSLMVIPSLLLLLYLRKKLKIFQENS